MSGTMPKIKQYVDNSDKDGSYILANVGGDSPVTLQVTDVAEKILHRTGYEPESNVPTSVVWSMYDVGLLYTSNVVDDTPVVGDRTDKIFQQLGVSGKLTYEERENLLGYLREYNGPRQDEVANLRDDIKQAQSSGTDKELDSINSQYDDVDEKELECLEILNKMEKEEIKKEAKKMVPEKLKELVKLAWKFKGWDVNVIHQSEKQETDIIAKKDGEKKLIQVERVPDNGTINTDKIREYSSFYLQKDNVESVCIVSTTSFSPQAQQLSRDLDIKTFDIGDIYDIIRATDTATDIDRLNETQTEDIHGDAEEFKDVYEEFLQVNSRFSESVLIETSTLAKKYGFVEGKFAMKGGWEKLQMAIKIRNKWAKLISQLDDFVLEIRPFVERMPEENISNLIDKQVENMEDLSVAYKNMLEYKDKLINSRFESNPINPGTTTQVEVPDDSILPNPKENIEQLVENQVKFTDIASIKIDKIGDLSDLRKQLINQISL